jgi:2-polyprenyl-3-methyl-5-hydroxy-6-metoxy-1,4-benzoquinol methylase
MSKDKKIVYKIEGDVDPRDVLCTTYQMRNFYKQFRDGFFSSLDVMNYIQHFRAAGLAKKGMRVLDVCCGRSLMLPLLRYYAKDIKSYTGVDISETNIAEAKRGAVKGDLTENELADYYPFDVEWVNANVAEMSDSIDKKFDFVIYTSAVEHMNKKDGAKSLRECYALMTSKAKMFLSCPNTPGNGYDTQYAAHVYEWGYDELKAELLDIGFEIVQEIGLIMGADQMKEHYMGPNVPGDVRKFYMTLKDYIPTNWLTSIMSVPYPEQSKEILFVVRKASNVKKLF